MSKQPPAGQVPGEMPEKPDESDLTDMQWRFVHEYTADQNATRAAVRAGYSAHTAAEQGCRLLKNVKVRSEVDALLAELNQKALKPREHYLRNLALIADADIGDFIRWNNDGSEEWVASSRLGRKRKAVKSYRNSKKDGRSIELRDSHKATLDILEILKNEPGSDQSAKEAAAQKVLGALQEAGDE